MARLASTSVRITTPATFVAVAMKMKRARLLIAG
jgi:hypothetical protein